MDTAACARDVDPLLPAGRELVRFTDAVLRAAGPDDHELVEARGALVDAVGEAGAARAATTAGNFEMMNRLLDAAGVPVPGRMLEVGRDLGVVH